jgi:ribonucleoside-diphosphate reductase alpha chain
VGAVRERLPDRRAHTLVDVRMGRDVLTIDMGEYADGRLGEIFLDHQHEGSFARAMANAFAICMSIGLQYGIPLAVFSHAFRDFKMEPDIIRSIFAELNQAYGPKAEE